MIQLFIGISYSIDSEDLDFLLQTDRIFLSITYGRGFCDGLIACPKELYWVSKQIKKPPVYEAAKGHYKDSKMSFK
jgi:hypothetical protein